MNWPAVNAPTGPEADIAMMMKPETVAESPITPWI